MCYLLHFINEYKFMQCVTRQLKGSKLKRYLLKNSGLYFADGFGSDGSVVKGLRGGRFHFTFKNR